MKDSEIMSKLLELLADFGEVALDVTLEEGLLKDIPVHWHLLMKTKYIPVDRLPRILDLMGVIRLAM
ncbi:hypothetical protein BMF77_pc00060 (plasmid) [Dolichospermum sp. UHCC 0315A]|jgi:hypothetical protein|uniref:hypothetical protein n=1 Tax=Dolichospermum sp. UHCC 0315A TaxID=1914871 RepID=UPI0011E7F342|nr:hypothetical protein [Dolichospermum sp. UHCC 0315A]QEI41478.1 hypothetical protein BMF77_02069 [Dolichospermum sp. UHCC 0315A]QEI44219.1 hypothetical protein BMF77_04850 [Dolichospermum sp. UHCC 0315A]QEI44491.1 hypothetical protein BMF77_pc00060 [Dolichospermum sp. UHCC 0315A]